MFASFSRGWSLTKTSFRVLKLDKEILLLPILSAIVMLGIIVVGVVFAGTVGLGLMATEGGGWLFLLALFGFYVLAYFTVLFFNAAVIECAMIRFNGGDPIVRDGLTKAWSRKGRILQWAIVAATVGIILTMLRQMVRNQESPMARIVGSIFVWIAEAAWFVVTFFAMPVLIYQDVGPIDALKRSWSTVKRSGGEQFVGAFAVSGLFTLGYLLVFGVGFLLIYFTTVPAILVLGVGVVLIAALAVVQSALQGILVAAAYKFVEDGRLPDALANEVHVVPSPSRPVY